MNKEYIDRLYKLEQEILELKKEIEAEKNKVINFKVGKQYAITDRKYGFRSIYLAVICEYNEYNLYNMETGNRFTDSVTKQNFNSKNISSLAKNYIFEEIT